MAADDDKRRHIVVDASVAGGVTPLADRDKLVDRDHTRKPGARFDLTVTGNLRAVTDHDLVFQQTIVPEMHIDHQQIAVAHNGILVRIHARMDGDVLADNIVVADRQAADLRVVT